MKPIALTGDLKQAFLQVQINEEDRDRLCFHWILAKDLNEVVAYHFTRAIFGLVQSPFLLGGTIDLHLDTVQSEYPETVQEIRKDLYVDDVIGGSETETEMTKFKQESIKIFESGGFTLHKWHSNLLSLKLHHGMEGTGESTCAKQELNVKYEASILGMAWNKTVDTLTIRVPEKRRRNYKA